MTRTALAHSFDILRKPALSLERILLATDFSSNSKPALEYTARLAREHGAVVYLVHVLTVLPPTGSPLPNYAVGDMEPIADVIRAGEFAASEMENLRHEDCLRGIRVKTFVRDGRLAGVVSEIARENKVDLVVAGTARRRGVQRVAFGSAAEQIVRTSPCPVLVVNGKKAPITYPGKSTVVCAIRHPACAESICYAWKLSRDRQARLVFVHVVESPTATAYSFDKAMTRAVMREDIMRAVSPAPMPKCELAIEYDFGYEGILDCARDHNATLIVMGAQKVDSFVETSTHLAHTTVGEVISRSACPVIAIPDRKQAVCKADDFADLECEIC